MNIKKDGKTYLVKKILSFNKYGKDEYDIEFEDEYDNYRHWQSWNDGGELIQNEGINEWFTSELKSMLEVFAQETKKSVEINEDYEIQSRVMINDKECYVIGYNPKNELCPYVTWLGSLRPNGWTYYWGHYCDTLQNALNDLGDRISNKRYEFDEPTQVLFKTENDKLSRSGIAYHDALIDLYDGEVLELNNPFKQIKILDQFEWCDLEELVGGDLVYLDESEGE